MGELAEGAVDLVEVSGDRYESGETATQVVTLINLANWEDAVSAERALIELLLTGGAPTIERQLNLLETSVAANQAGQVALANDLEGFDMSETIDDPSTQALFQLRQQIRTSSTDDLPQFTVDASRGSERLIEGIHTQQDSITEQIRGDIEQERSDATENQRNILLGTLLIIVGTACVLFFLYRAITQPITQLSKRGTSVAEEELPTMVTKIRSGEATAGTQKIVPLKSDTDDEIGELVSVFNNLHITAVSLAAEQAQSRQTASEMFVNLGHRNQRILDTVLRDLDELERDEQDPTRLAQLYNVDQKVTRMRRNAESLLVLAGTQTPRQWAEPAAMADVVRASMSEVENFERVVSTVEADVRIPGRAVADVTHLLAELIENSLRFSPPEEVVRVSSTTENGRTVVSITDTGFGMNAEKLAAANDSIEQAAHNDETPSKHLGHFVVGRLSARHGVSVLLEGNQDGGGLVALVDLGELTSNPEERVPGRVGGDSSPDETNDASIPHVDADKSARIVAVTDAPSAEQDESVDDDSVEETPVAAETSESQVEADKVVAGEAPTSSTAEKMPTIKPAVPLSEEVASHSEGVSSRSKSSSPEPQPQTAHAEKQSAPTDEEPPKRQTPPDFEEMSTPRQARKRVPGEALGKRPTSPTPNSSVPRSKAKPADPEAVRDAFSGFQKSAAGVAPSVTTDSPPPPPSTPTKAAAKAPTKAAAKAPTKAAAKAPTKVSNKAKTERRAQPDFAEMTKPRAAKRRVPGASLPAGLNKSSKKTPKQAAATTAKPEEVRDAFAGFQKSANPSTNADTNTESNES